MVIGGIMYKEVRGVIKCYDVNGVELESTIDEICSRGEILILETDEDYKKLKSMVEESEYDYKFFLNKIYSCGRYKFFEDYDRFLREFSYRDACDILRLCSDKMIVCYVENDKYYVGVFDK